VSFLRDLWTGDDGSAIAGARWYVLCDVDALGPTGSDRLIFLGDYVNGGLDSAGVIDRLIGLRRTIGAVCLRGNHDDAFERALRSPGGAIGFLAMGGVSTLQSYEEESLAKVPREHAEFLAGLPLSWHDAGLICVHGRIGREDRPEAPDRGLALWGRVQDAEPQPIPRPRPRDCPVPAVAAHRGQ
jgi:hypothetical protein